VRRRYYSDPTQNQYEHRADRQQSRKVETIFRQKKEHPSLEDHETRKHQATHTERRMSRQERRAGEPKENQHQDGGYYCPKDR
jgi:hypothetical protein